MAWQMIGAASWDSSMVSLMLGVSLGAVDAHVGPLLRQFSDGKLLLQGRLAAWHGQVLAYTHFTPGWCVQHWGIVRGIVTVVLAVPMFIGPPLQRLCRGRLAIV